MIEPVLLMTWTVLGVVIAAVHAPRETPRFAWAPIAAVLGPLWLAVAHEQRLADRQRHRYQAMATASPREGGAQ